MKTSKEQKKKKKHNQSGRTDTLRKKSEMLCGLSRPSHPWKKKENLLITLRVWLKIADEMMTVRGLDDTAQSAALSRNFSEEVQQKKGFENKGIPPIKLI